MKNKEQIKNDLKEFISTDKFSTYLHLQPAVANSTPEDKLFINTELNACCTALLEALEKLAVSEDQLRQIVRDSLERVKDHGLDTEDEEFCYQLYAVIGDILGIDIEDHSVSYEQKMIEDLAKLAMKAGIDLSKLKPPGK